MTSIQEQLKELNSVALDAIASSNSLDELEQLRVKYLGKKGQLSQILRGMGKLSPEERPVVGSQANVVKSEVQTSLEQRKQDLAADQPPGARRVTWEPRGIALAYRRARSPVFP